MNAKVIYIIGLLFAAALAQPGTSLADSTVTLSPAGNGVFVLQATGVENVGGMDITIHYDPTALANPRMVQGSLISQALTAINAASPGSVRFGVIRSRPMEGSGVIGTLTFDLKGNSVGKIDSLAAVFISADGDAVPVLARVIGSAAGAN